MTATRSCTHRWSFPSADTPIHVRPDGPIGPDETEHRRLDVERMEVSHRGGRRHPVLSVRILEEAVDRLLVLPEGGRELEAWRPRKLHAWRALSRERLASPRCGTREAAAPQLLEG
jgi:hypothetical protein